MGHTSLARAILLVILLLAALIYLPALNSGFFMDDYPNLYQLPEIRESGYFNYIFSGVSSFLGRPLSLASFALQYPQWPAHPFAFKAVNLAIHLINGILVFSICNRLSGRLHFSPRETVFFSCTVAALWLLHPIQITTTLYVVQRMTQLSAFFTLTGILFYLRFRPDPGKDTSYGSMLATGAGLYLFLFMAVLCKENGILLPLYLLIIEATLLREKHYSRMWQVWAFLFLCLPLLFLGAYLGSQLDDILRGYTFRPYSVQERLLTQAVVLLDYLYRILLPTPGAFSLFHDDFPISSGLFSPPATFLSLCGIGLLLGAGVTVIRQYPAISFAIIWFFGGHLLESSFLNLELYFEHRNYLPSLGVFVALVWGVIVAVRRTSHKMLVVFVAGTYVLFVLINTVMETRLWADPMLQAREWSKQRPESPRAMNNLANMYIKTGNIPVAIEVFQKIAALFPGEVYPALKVTALRACALDERTSDREWAALFKKAATAGKDSFNSNVTEVNAIVSAFGDNDCPGLDAGTLMKLLMILAANPNFGHVKSHLYDQAALLSLYTGDIYNAVRHVQQAMGVSASVPRQIFKVKLLLALGDVKTARDACSWIERRIATNYRERLAYKSELTRLQHQIESAVAGYQGHD